VVDAQEPVFVDGIGQDLRQYPEGQGSEEVFQIGTRPPWPLMEGQMASRPAMELFRI